MPIRLLTDGRRKKGKKEWVKPLLIELRKHGCMLEAIRTVGVHRSTVYKHIERFPIFRTAIDKAILESHERIYQSAFRRGVEGYQEPVIYQGQLSGWYIDQKGRECPPETPGARFRPLTVTKYSDTLLLALLKAKVKGFQGIETAQTPQSVTINNQVNQVIITQKEQFLARVREYRSALDSDGGNGQPMDSPPSPPTTNGFHAKPGT